MAQGQYDEEAPPPKPTGVRITFLPPPLVGVCSLGIFDKAGKLVRTLHQEATQEAFVVGLNGFITQWDGKDDQGQVAPAGKYSARGYAVGQFEVDGKAFHCNEWADAPDLPRIAQVASIRMGPGEQLLVSARDLAGAVVDLRSDNEGNARVAAPTDLPVQPAAAVPNAEPPVRVRAPLIAKDGVLVEPEDKLLDLSLPGLEKPLMACSGLENAVWVIDKTATGIELKEYTAQRILLRRMAISPGDPEPVQIAASPVGNTIFLLERGQGVERVRGLTLEVTSLPEAPVEGEVVKSTWKTFLSKAILASGTFPQVSSTIGRTKPFTPEAKIRVRLLPNPLFQEAMHEVEIRLLVDKEGAYFQSLDGLTLRHVTDTEHLKWAVMGHEGTKSVTLFQSDGAVVEEFVVAKLANLMAFDAGDYKWVPPK